MDYLRTSRLTGRVPSVNAGQTNLGVAEFHTGGAGRVLVISAGDDR